MSKLKLPPIKLPFKTPSFKIPGLGKGASGKSVGLDIGFHSVKIVEVVSHASGFEITNFAIKEIPPSVLSLPDRAQALGQMIKQMFEEKKFDTDQVYLSVSGHNVVIRHLELPKIPKEEILDATRWNAKEEVLFSVEDAFADYHITGEVTKDDGVSYYQLLSVIVRADIVPFLVSIADKAGLKPLGVTIIPLALWNYDSSFNQLEPGTVTSYIDMGAERTRVYFVIDGELRFSREIPNGGKNVTGAITGDYTLEDETKVNVDAVRAETIKKTYGLPAEDSLEITQEGIPLLDIRERILPVVEKQLEEFMRSIDYFKNQYKQNAVHRVILSGGSGSLKGFYQFLAANLEIPIDRCNPLFQSTKPLANVSQEKTKLLGPSLTTAAGLALGKASRINVLPEELRYFIKKDIIKWAPYSLIPIFIIAIMLVSSSIRGKVEASQKRLNKIQLQLATLQATAEAAQNPAKVLEKMIVERESLEKQLKDLPGVYRVVDIKETLNEIAKLIPPETSLLKLVYKAKRDKKDEKRGDIYLKGIFFGNERTSLQALTNFLNSLKESPFFTIFKLEDTEAEGTEIYTSPGLKFKISVFPKESENLSLRKANVKKDAKSTS